MTESQSIPTIKISSDRRQHPVWRLALTGAMAVGTLAVPGQIYAAKPLVNLSSQFTWDVLVASDGESPQVPLRSFDAKKESNLHKIRVIASYADDWNGAGARAFDEESIHLFNTAIERLDIQPDIAPTGRMSLLLQYINSQRGTLAFELAKERIDYVVASKRDYSDAQVGTFSGEDVSAINAMVEDFYANKSA